MFKLSCDVIFLLQYFTAFTYYFAFVDTDIMSQCIVVVIAATFVVVFVSLVFSPF